MIGAMNAAERFFAASQARDLDAVFSQLAPEVVMVNPGDDDPIVGRGPVAGALGAVVAACDEFRHVRLLASESADQAPLFGLLFEARVGDETLTGVDLLELDEHDRIRRFTGMARPMSALMALGARMSGRPNR